MSRIFTETLGHQNPNKETPFFKILTRQRPVNANPLAGEGEGGRSSIPDRRGEGGEWAYQYISFSPESLAEAAAAPVMGWRRRPR